MAICRVILVALLAACLLGAAPAAPKPEKPPTLAELREMVRELRAEVAALKAEVAALKAAQAPPATGKAPTARDEDEIARAIAGKRFTVGMTDNEVERVIRSLPDVRTNNRRPEEFMRGGEKVKRLTWEVSSPDVGNRRIVAENGVVISVR